jgi:hypothetical protein
MPRYWGKAMEHKKRGAIEGVDRWGEGRRGKQEER